MTPKKQCSFKKREHASSPTSLPMAERRSIAEATMDIFIALRSRQRAWTAPELATLLNLCKRTVYQAAATGQLPAIHIGTSLRINPADALAWVEAGTTGLRSSQEAA